MKKILSLLMLALLLLGLVGCGGPKVTEMEDTNAYGRKYGNNLSAEQGDWLVMYGADGEEPALLLYHKKEQTSEVLLNGNITQVALLDLKVYYSILEDNALYCYDLTTEETEVLLEDVMYYQVRDGMIYYVDFTPGNYIETYELETKAIGRIPVSYTVDSFWLTEDAIYYSDDDLHILMCRPYDNTQDRIIHKASEGLIRDVIPISGENIAFLVVAEDISEATLCYYESETKALTRYLTGKFEHFNYVRDHAVMVIGSKIYAVDIANDQVYQWGALSPYASPQIWSDCIIVYDGANPSIQYYPDSTAPAEGETVKKGTDR